MTKSDKAGRSLFITDFIVAGNGGLKEAEAAWKAHRAENGVSRGGVAAEFYELLKEGVMEETEFAAWIAGQSDNVFKHKSHYNAIRELTNHIHNIYE